MFHPGHGVGGTVTYQTGRAEWVSRDPAKIVLKTDDVVFTEIVPYLYFDEDERLWSRIGHAMSAARPDEDMISDAKPNVASIEGCNGLTPDDHPVL